MSNGKLQSSHDQVLQLELVCKLNWGLVLRVSVETPDAPYFARIILSLLKVKFTLQCYWFGSKCQR